MKVRALEVHPPPDSERSGLHVSDLIQRLLQMKDPKKYSRGEPGVEVRWLWELGLAWETYALTKLLPSMDIVPMLTQEPREVDGVQGTVDGLDPDAGVIVECKLTEISSQNSIEDPRFWSWRVQGMAYCRLWDLNTVVYPVCFLRGNYNDVRREVRVWQVRYSALEIARNWRMLLNARDDLREEQANGSTRESEGEG